MALEAPLNSTPYSSGKDSDALVTSLKSSPGSLFRFFDTDVRKKEYSLGEQELTDLTLYIAAFLEFVGTFLFEAMHVGFYASSVDPTHVALGHAFTWTILLIAFGPICGGHFNPLITLTTVYTGHMYAVRACLYIIMQILGAFLAALAMEHIYAFNSAAAFRTCGYTSDSGVGRQIANEFILDIFFLAFVYGIALNSRASSYLGSIFVTVAVGVGYGLLIFATYGLSSVGVTYGGNLAFCLGASYAYQHIDNRPADFTNCAGGAWAGGIMASIVYAVIHFLTQQDYAYAPVEEKQRNDARLKTN